MDSKQNQPNNPGNRNPDGRKPKSLWITLIISVALVLVISLIYNSVVDSQYTQTTYSDFLKEMANNNLAEVELEYDRVYYLTKTEAAKPAAQQKACFTGLPEGDVMALATQLYGMGVKVNQVIVEDNSGIILVLYYIVMFALIFGVMRTLS